MGGPYSNGILRTDGPTQRGKHLVGGRLRALGGHHACGVGMVSLSNAQGFKEEQGSQ